MFVCRFVSTFCETASYGCLSVCCLSFFFFKQKTAYEMRISDWSSDVCSSDLGDYDARGPSPGPHQGPHPQPGADRPARPDAQSGPCRFELGDLTCTATINTTRRSSMPASTNSATR